MNSERPPRVTGVEGPPVAIPAGSQSGAARWLRITNTSIALSLVEATTLTSSPAEGIGGEWVGGGETYMSFDHPGSGYVGLAFSASEAPAVFSARLFAWTVNGDFLEAFTSNTLGGVWTGGNYAFTWVGVTLQGSSFSIRTPQNLNVDTPVDTLWQMTIHVEAIWP